MTKKVLAVLLACAMLTLSLAGCGKKTQTAADGSAAGTDTGAEKLAATQEIQLQWAATNFYSFDNNKNYAAEEILVQAHVLEGLTRPSTDADGNQKILPAGAESWETSEDGLTWTFHLREYYWTDGVQVTAQNFVDSFRRIGDPRLACDFAFFLDDLVGGTELYNMDAETATAEQITAAQEALGVKAVDDTTLQFTLKQASPQFLSKVSTVFLAPIRLDVIEKAGELYDTDYTTHVWCGPFVVTDFVKDNSMVLEKNAKYWDADNVKLTKVTLLNIEEVSTQNTMFKNGELAALKPTGDYVQPYRDGTIEGDYTYIHGDGIGVSYFYFNRNGASPSGLMESQKIRLAMSLAVNRAEFTSLIFDRNYEAYGFVPFGVMTGDLNFRDDVEEPLKSTYDEYNLDTDKPVALFKEGMSDLGDTRALSDVTLTYITTGDTAIKKQQQEYWKSVWEKTFGITVNVNVLGDSSLFREERNAGRFDIGSASWNGDYNDPMAFLDMWTSTGMSIRYSGWTAELGAKFEEIFNKLQNETDLAKREQVYAEAEKWVVLDEVAAIPYMYSDRIFCVSNKVKNLVLPYVGAEYDFSRAYVVE